MRDEIVILIRDRELKVNLENNISTTKLREKLKENDIIIDMHDYGNFEKVGELGFNLERVDSQMKTNPGDIVLYQGNQIVIFYGSNTWDYTKIGSITNVDSSELKEILGTGNISITLKLKEKNK